jgi:hypothetical protein
VETAKGEHWLPSRNTSTVEFVITGPIARADIPGLCDLVRLTLEEHGRADLVLCDAGALYPDAITIDALARLQLTARRLGCRVRFLRTCGELRDLLAFVGLGEVLALDAELRLDPGWQAEEREQVRGVEEEADPGDTAV